MAGPFAPVEGPAAELRRSRQLVHVMTSAVAARRSADVLLACGATPACVVRRAEVEAFVAKCGALCVNVGMLTEDRLEASLLAAGRARDLGVPWVLDPVAAGGSPARLRACIELLNLGPRVVRGNPSEILALWDAREQTRRQEGPEVGGRRGRGKRKRGAPRADAQAERPRGRGPDSTCDPEDGLRAARSLASACSTIVCMTGAVDFIVGAEGGAGLDRADEIQIEGGSSMCTAITGAGCALSALIAAFVAAWDSARGEGAAARGGLPEGREQLAARGGGACLRPAGGGGARAAPGARPAPGLPGDSRTPAAHACLLFKAAAARAARDARGPGSFAAALLDQLNLLSSGPRPPGPGGPRGGPPGGARALLSNR